jgi:hypothetical protein
MDTSNIIAIVLGGLGFIISIVGFVLTPMLNLKSKRLEKRLEYRFMLFQKVLELWESTHNDPNLSRDGYTILMKEINKLIQLYGYNSEIKSFKEVVNSYNNLATEHNEINRQKLIKKFDDFFSTSFNAYRKEIAMSKLSSVK